MAKKTDRRVKRTRHLLQNALLELILEKGYEEVTVQNVIDRADVGRSTFYAHFRDMEELLLSEFEDMRSQFEQHLKSRGGEHPDVWNIPLTIFQHAEGHHKIYKALVGKKSGNIILNQASNYLSQLMLDHLKAAPQNSRPETIPVEILVQYLISSLMGLLTWWLDHDLPYPPERMSDIYKQLTLAGLEGLLTAGS